MSIAKESEKLPWQSVANEALAESPSSHSNPLPLCVNDASTAAAMSPIFLHGTVRLPSPLSDTVISSLTANSVLNSTDKPI